MQRLHDYEHTTYSSAGQIPPHPLTMRLPVFIKLLVINLALNHGECNSIYRRRALVGTFNPKTSSQQNPPVVHMTTKTTTRMVGNRTAIDHVTVPTIAL